MENRAFRASSGSFATVGGRELTRVLLVLNYHPSVCKGNKVNKVNKGNKVLSLLLYDDSIYPISHSLFMQKKVLFLHLL